MFIPLGPGIEASFPDPKSVVWDGQSEDWASGLKALIPAVEGTWNRIGLRKDYTSLFSIEVESIIIKA